MICATCSRETAVDRVFCNWCRTFLPEPSAGARAGTARRFAAAVIDPFLFYVFWAVPAAVLGMTFQSSAVFFTVAILIARFGAYLILLGRSQTFGKMMLTERVVMRETGHTPGILRMLVRETLGKMLSALVFGVGYLWALFDNDGQAWHDKLTGTVEVKTGPPRTSPVPSGSTR